MVTRGIFYVLTMFGVLVVVGVVSNIIFAVSGIEVDQMSFFSLLGVCAVMGFGGSIISILMSKTLVKKQMGVRVITNPSNDNEKWLVETVAYLAKQKGVKMPEVGIYPAEEMNAFATGWNKDAALVAVSTGLFSQMSQEEIAAVLGHEMSHVSNGDMVTMGLVQGITNTFVYALSYVLASVLSAKAGNSRSSSNSSFYLFSSVFQVVFGFLATAVVMWFSRWREFHADAGAAKVYGSQAMINALLALQNNSRRAASMSAREANSRYRRKSANMNALCISVPSNIRELFASHPSIERRIEALKKLP